MASVTSVPISSQPTVYRGEETNKIGRVITPKVEDLEFKEL